MTIISFPVVDLYLVFSVSQMQMFQVWLQLSEVTGRLQISSVTEGGPGHEYIWGHSIWRLLEPILRHSCRGFTEVSAMKMYLYTPKNR